MDGLKINIVEKENGIHVRLLMDGIEINTYDYTYYDGYSSSAKMCASIFATELRLRTSVSNQRISAMEKWLIEQFKIYENQHLDAKPTKSKLSRAAISDTSYLNRYVNTDSGIDRSNYNNYTNSRRKQEIADEFVDKFFSNYYAISQFALDTYMEKISENNSCLIPTKDKVPKSINFVTFDGNKYYGKVGKVMLLPKLDQNDVKRTFDEDAGNAVVIFCINFEKGCLAIEIEYVGKSTNDTTVAYYKTQTWRKFDWYSDIAVFACDFNDFSTLLNGESNLNEWLKAPYEYFFYQLKELNEKAEKIKNEVDLPLLRRYYEKFSNLIVDEGLYVIPIKGKVTKLKGFSMMIKSNQKNAKNKYDFFEGIVNKIPKEEYESYVLSLKEDNIILPDGVELALIDLVYLSDREIYLFTNALINEKTLGCTIVNNIEGEKVRLSRILAGIKKAVSGDVANPQLVETICKNDINISVNANKSKYIPNEKYIEKLKDKYTILTDNEEQLMALDKIKQMVHRNVDLVLVQGPPGTGKTELILSLAKELSDSNYNVLITSNVHVACDNVVDRLKGNKDIVLKRYTSTKGEQYDKEVTENKIKYVENQILENFKYKDSVLKSIDDYNAVLNLIENSKTKIQELTSIKKEYLKKIEKYNDLLRDRKMIFEEINKFKEDKAKLEIEKDKFFPIIESLNRSISENKVDIEKIDTEINNLYELDNKKEAEKESKKSELIKCLKKCEDSSNTLGEYAKGISKLNLFIEDCQNKIQSAKQVKDAFKDISLKVIKEDIINYFCTDEPLKFKYLDVLMKDSMQNINNLKVIYEKIKNDVIQNQVKLSKDTIQYLEWERSQSNLLDSILNKDALNYIPYAYKYCNLSDKRKKWMHIMPFSKIDGYDIEFYEKAYNLVNCELNKIIFGYSNIISQFIETNISNESINSIIASFEGDINKLYADIELSKVYLEELNGKNEQQIKDNHELLKEKSIIEKTIDEIGNAIGEMQTIIFNLKDQKENLLDSNEKLNNQIHNNEKEQQELNAKTENLESVIKDKQVKLESIEQMIQIERDKNPSLIDDTDNYIKKIEIEKKNADKELDICTNCIKQITNMIDMLKKDGWNEKEAYEFIFDYTKELDKVVKSDPEKAEYYFTGRGNEFEKMFLLSEAGNGSLISMTTNQIASFLKYEDTEIEFDYAIVDEASKCRFEDLIVALPRIKHLVLIGDFMQLDPMYENYDNIDLVYQNILSMDEWDAINKSSFSLLFSQFVKLNKENGVKDFDSNRYVAVMKRQYRMNKGIFALIEPIYAIHDGFDLIDEKQLTSNDVKCIDINGREILSGTSQYNIVEADAIISFIKEFQKNRDNYPNIKTIGIITGYRAQENYLRRGLKSIKIPGLQIGTFDRFQGREYDLVIVSLVRTEKLGFTNNIRRMNVAFSRAKNHLLIFGNMDALNRIALKTTGYISEYGNNDENENSFVVKKMIPYLYQIRENYVSDSERVKALMNFIKENDYDEQWEV